MFKYLHTTPFEVMKILKILHGYSKFIQLVRLKFRRVVCIEKTTQISSIKYLKLIIMFWQRFKLFAHVFFSSSPFYQLLILYIYFLLKAPGEKNLLKS